jgi:hypothetical protein
MSGGARAGRRRHDHLLAERALAHNGGAGAAADEARFVRTVRVR